MLTYAFLTPEQTRVLYDASEAAARRTVEETYARIYGARVVVAKIEVVKINQELSTDLQTLLRGGVYNSCFTVFRNRAVWNRFNADDPAPYTNTFTTVFFYFGVRKNKKFLENIQKQIDRCEARLRRKTRTVQNCMIAPGMV